MVALFRKMDIQYTALEDSNSLCGRNISALVKIPGLKIIPFILDEIGRTTRNRKRFVVREQKKESERFISRKKKD